MEYQDIVIAVDTQRIQDAADIAILVASDGIYIEDYSDLEEQVLAIAHTDLIEQDLLEQDRRMAKLHIYLPPSQSAAEVLSFLEARLTQENISYSFAQQSVSEEDWANAWKAYFKPVRVSKRLVIQPSWESYTPLADDLVLVLDPSMAFGTGAHETTRLCLQLLEDAIAPGARILDVGCGSGILACCGLLLGASFALGVDLNADAVTVAQENAQRNGLQDKSQFLQSDLTHCVTGKFDILCANITADVLVTLIPKVRDFLNPSGILILSGILTMHADMVLDCAKEHRLIPEKMLTEKDWVALCCRLALI